MLQQEAIDLASNQSTDQAIATADGAPAIVVPRQRGVRSTAPVIGALVCLGLILFLIASTIVLSLIPVYLGVHNIPPVQRTQEIIIRLPQGTTLQTGPLNTAQKQALQTQLQTQLNSVARTKGATIRVVDATALASIKRKRQTAAVFIQATVIISSLSLTAITSVASIINQLILSPTAIAFLESQGLTVATTTTTTTTTTLITTTNSNNSSRSLVRRSMEEGGAPAGIVYVDSHRIAETKGLVSSVSFYVDQTCALATVEFGAFDLINRTLDINNAELVLTHRSKSIKLGDTSELKQQMSLITIKLCDKNATKDRDDDECKGTQFEVLAHQFIGVRSDTCRLGFAPTPNDRVQATTWKPADQSDPFAKPYKVIKYVPSDYTVLQSITIEPAKLENNRISTIDKTRQDASRVLFIGTYPPRRCGLATFLKDLTDSYQGPYNVIAIDEQGADLSSRTYSEEVIYQLNQTDRYAYDVMAKMINSGPYDIINIQHEYGLFGGMMGEYILRFMDAVQKPIVLTMHTIIPEPHDYMKSITRALCALSTRVIIMANLGHRLLIDVYGVDKSKIVLIPHGVPDVSFDHSLASAKMKIGLDPNTPTMSTFGLIHRNKNIQLVLKAMQSVVKDVPNMMYLIIGQTHPMVMKHEGEIYRKGLERNVSALGLTNNVRFINKFVDDDELLDYLRASDIYVTPYACEDQYVSGTLSWAVGLGKVVISTPYLYAKELLSNGRGYLVSFTDDTYLSSTVINVIKNDEIRYVTRRKAYKYGRQMTWPHVTKDLEQLFDEILLSLKYNLRTDYMQNYIDFIN